MIIQILKSIGLLKVNDEYMKPVNNKLDEINTNIESVAKVAHSCAQIVDALEAENIRDAVYTALKFCKIDDEVAQLKEIKDKIANGVTIEAATAAADVPKLGKEIVESVSKEATDNYANIVDVLPDIKDVIELIGGKLTSLDEVATNWSFTERLGTVDAVRSSGAKIKQIQASAETAKSELSTLLKSLEAILSHYQKESKPDTDKQVIDIKRSAAKKEKAPMSETH